MCSKINVHNTVNIENVQQLDDDGQFAYICIDRAKQYTERIGIPFFLHIYIHTVYSDISRSNRSIPTVDYICLYRYVSNFLWLPYWAWVCKYLSTTLRGVACVIRTSSPSCLHTHKRKKGRLLCPQTVISLPSLFTELHVSSLKTECSCLENKQGSVVMSPVVSGGKFTPSGRMWFS